MLNVKPVGASRNRLALRDLETSTDLPNTTTDVTKKKSRNLVLVVLFDVIVITGQNTFTACKFAAIATQNTYLNFSVKRQG